MIAVQIVICSVIIILICYLWITSLFFLMVELDCYLTVLTGGILHLLGVLYIIGGEQELLVFIDEPVKPETLSRSQHEHIVTHRLVVDRNLNTKMCLIRILKIDLELCSVCQIYNSVRLGSLVFFEKIFGDGNLGQIVIGHKIRHT